jgi:hypothetical protein
MGEWPNTQLLLIVKPTKNGTTTIFDPQATQYIGKGPSRIGFVDKYENSSFTAEDQRSIIKNVESFDKDNSAGRIISTNNSAGRIISTNNGTYMITASSNNLPKAYDIANPIDNHAHNVAWEWVIIRQVPDVQSTINSVSNVLGYSNDLGYYNFLNWLIISIFILAISGIGVAMLIYNRIRRKNFY